MSERMDGDQQTPTKDDAENEDSSIPRGTSSNKVHGTLPPDFDKKWITKMKIRFRRPGDSQSQELSCPLIGSQGSDDTGEPASKLIKLDGTSASVSISTTPVPSSSAIYEKEVFPQPEDGEYQIRTTRDLNNDWANCCIMLKRQTKPTTSALKKVFKGLLQKAVLQKFIEHFNEPDDYQLVASDWPRLEELATSGQAVGMLLVEGESEEVEDEDEVEDLNVSNESTGSGKGKVPTYLFLLKKGGENILCYSCPRLGGKGFRRNAICRSPGCLSSKQTTLDFPWCKQHKGVEQFGLVEFYHARGEINCVCSTIFSYSVGEEQSDDRKKELFLIAWNDSLRNIPGWTNYKKEVKKADYSERTLHIMNKKTFPTPEEAEQYLAMIQTTRLMSKFAESPNAKPKIRLLNSKISLAYKCEGQMSEEFTKATDLSIQCVKVDETQSFPLPTQMGRRPLDQNEKVPIGEGIVYFQSTKDINYSGKFEKKGGKTSQKMSDQAILKYFQVTGQKIDDSTVLFTQIGSLEEIENIVNTANYLAHLFKVPNPFTKEDFTCLNKVVKTSIIEKFNLVKDFCRHFFKIDISFVPASSMEVEDIEDEGDEWSFL